MLGDIRGKARQAVASYRNMINSRYGQPVDSPAQAEQARTTARKQGAEGIEQALERAREVQQAISELMDSEP